MLPEGLRAGYDKLKAGVARRSVCAVSDDADREPTGEPDDVPGDELPEDLDVTELRRPVRLPRRQAPAIAGTIYLVLGGHRPRAVGPRARTPACSFGGGPARG